MPQELGKTDSFPVMRVIRDLSQQYPRLSILILSMHISHAIVEGLLMRGVRGYLLKNDELHHSLTQYAPA